MVLHEKQSHDQGGHKRAFLCGKVAAFLDKRYKNATEMYIPFLL